MMRKRLFMLFFLLALFFLVGCVSKTEQPALPENDSLLSEEELSLPNETNELIPASLPAGACTPGWACISGQLKAYRTENCTFVQRRECPLGCQNDTCRASSVCEQGFKCLDERRVGYQTLVCTWDHVKECPAGCVNGDCLPENATVQNATETPALQQPEEAPAPPPDTSKSLRPGEQAIVENDGEEYVLEIYILEEGRVRLSLDGAKSDWLEEGNSFTARGITVTVKEILFQSYGGGTREIRYTIT